MSQIKGRLVRDAEVKQFESGSRVVNFTIAVNDSYKKKNGEEVERVEFFNCAYWFDTSIEAILKKGKIVEVSGWISARVYQKGDEHKAQLEMQVQSVRLPFLPKKKDAEEAQTPEEVIVEQPKEGTTAANKKRQPRKQAMVLPIEGVASKEGGLPF